MTSRVPPRERCPHCGHDVATGRFCSDCGRPLPGVPDDTAERPPVQDGPTQAPETSPWGEVGGGQHPPAARWPLYADQAAADPVGRPAAAPRDDASGVLPFAPLAGQDPRPAGRSRRGGVVGWVVGAVVVLLVAALGAFLLLGGLSGDHDAATSAVDASTTTSSPTVTPTPSVTATPTPPPLQPVDVTGSASVTASSTAPPSVDVGGAPVRYDAANMVDGAPGTAWRVAGDGSGVDITVTLAAPTVVTRLGLINGYAKIEAGYDGYAANRRLTTVEWVLDGGTTVRQDLVESTGVQTVDVADVETTTLTLRLLGTTAPGSEDGRDFTAISELQVVGDPR